MMLLFVLLAAAALLAFREAYARLWARGAQARVSVEEPFVYAGEQAHLTETVANRGQIPLPELEVRFRIPQGPVFRDAENVIISDHIYKRDVFALRPQEEVLRKYVLQCPRRGVFPVSDLTMRARSLFHMREYEMDQHTDACVTVYAARTDVSGILAHCDAVLGSLESRRRTIEDPFSWSGIRAYTPQDPMRAVNWKATARAGELLVNTYASVQAVRFVLCLDVSDEHILKQEELVELAISTAASLCRRLIGRGQEAGLYVFGAEPQSIRIPPARGRAQLTRIEQALTEDLTGSQRRLAGTEAPSASSRAKDRTEADAARRETSAFAGWAFEQSREMPDLISVFISKEEDSLRQLQQLLRGAPGTAVSPMPSILVQPLLEDGVRRLRVRTV